jgi:serine/threonine-protein kinase RsbW
MSRDGDRIELGVPLKKEYARMVRLVVGAIAGQRGFDIDRVDDVKLAAEEAFLLAMGLASDAVPVTITLDSSEDVIKIRMSGIAAPQGGGPEQSQEARGRRYGLFVLNAVADTAEISAEDGTTVIEISISARGGA